VSKHDKIQERVLSGTADANVNFDDLCKMLERKGFGRRIKGDHHIFTREGIAEIINIQPLKDGKAKSYQVKQVRNILERL